MDAGIASIDDTQTQGLNMSAFVRRSMVVSALLVGATLASSPALAQRKSAQDQRKEQMAQIPTCARPLGSISVLEPEDATNWWTGQQLPAPSKLIKVFVSKSRCFTLVDRGAGMNAAMRERELAAGGELRQRSNLGKGQIKAADYVMVPDLIVNLDLDTGEPITTEVLRYGQRVAVLGLPVHPLMKTEKALDVVGPKAFGYPELAFVPIVASQASIQG